MPESDLAKANHRPDDLVAAILRDHAEIKQLFTEVAASAPGAGKREAFERLVRKLAVHEVAEQEVVRPLTRKAPEGDAVAEARLEEESKGKDVIAELEKMGVDDARFDSRLETLRYEVLAHAEREEREEHPKLKQAVDEGQLQNLVSLFHGAEKTAPTHPHPKGPESAVGNLIVGPFAAIADRARDAIREARKK